MMDQRERVLLVDDEQHVLRTLELLCEQSYVVHAARCVDTGRTALDAMQFDVLITDYHLGDKKGTDLLEGGPLG